MVLLLASSAAADDSSLRFRTPAVCITEGGSTVSIPIGRFMPEPMYLELNDKWKDMENEVTGLQAENKSLKASEGAPGWKSISVAVVVGILLGRYALDD